MKQFGDTQGMATGKIQKVYEDGRKEILYHNGSIKKVLYPNSSSRTYFANGDIQDDLPDGTVNYYFSETKTKQLNLPNGIKVFEFQNGQVETHYPDGSKDIQFPDGASAQVPPVKAQVPPRGRKSVM